MKALKGISLRASIQSQKKQHQKSRLKKNPPLLQRLNLAALSSLAGVALEKRLRKRITLSNRVVPDLIGGVRVIVDNKMMDLSLRGRLEGLRKRMLEAPLSSKAEA